MSGDAGQARKSLPRGMSGVLTNRRAHASVKPRMRGWVHLASAVGFAASGTALIAQAATSGPPVAAGAVAIYVAAVPGLFGVSAIYHLVTWRSHRARTWMRRKRPSFAGFVLL